ncbi:MAG: ATP-binding protein [Deltaproteobacteria bacterium]|nr:ATP-binding protein [Deltaproteobacteria bacterium]
MALYETTTFNRLSHRIIYDKIKKLQSVVLFGPRQTGKSTLLEGIFSELPSGNQIRIYFQLPSERQRFDEEPELLIREVDAKKGGGPLFVYIDEIQKVPKILEVLQFLIDKKKIVLAASGSSARKMKKIGTNWLPGRIHLEHLYPLSWRESRVLEAAVPLEELLLYGSMPGILAKRDLRAREEDLAAYAHLYLEEEIRSEALIRDLPRFTKFLRLAALESGSSPNYSKIGSQIGVSHTTIREYFQILEDSLIIHRLDAFGSSRDQVLRRSRYYFFDMGVRNAAAQLGHSSGLLPLQRGLLFEHFVLLEVVSQLKYKSGLSFWRTKQGQEVDLVIEKDNRCIALEIKATRTPSRGDLKGLEAFSKKYRSSETLLVCQVIRPQKFGSHVAIPWQELPDRLGL